MYLPDFLAFLGAAGAAFLGAAALGAFSTAGAGASAPIALAHWSGKLDFIIPCIRVQDPKGLLANI